MTAFMWFTSRISNPEDSGSTLYKVDTDHIFLFEHLYFCYLARIEVKSDDAAEVGSKSNKYNNFFDLRWNET